jgi:hypothetical protein
MAAITLTALDATPNDCALAAPLQLTVRDASAATVQLSSDAPARSQWQFTASAPLRGAVWDVTYVVDVAEHNHALPLGSTAPTDYAPGPCAAAFACDAIHAAGVPARRAGWCARATAASATDSSSYAPFHTQFAEQHFAADAHAA